MEKLISISDEVVISKIYRIRGMQVMIDRDLAELYNVKTKVLKQAVRRNRSRFPEDFMFAMTSSELNHWRSQFVTSNDSNSIKMGLRYAPFCFSEAGVAMLSSVLKSERAIEVNIRIIRIFTKIRNMLLQSKDLVLKMNEIEKKVDGQDEKIAIIFEYLRQFVKQEEEPRRRIGYN